MPWLHWSPHVTAFFNLTTVVVVLALAVLVQSMTSDVAIWTGIGIGTLVMAAGILVNVSRAMRGGDSG